MGRVGTRHPEMAGAQVPATHVQEGRGIGRADGRVCQLRAQRAARMEAAAGRRVERAGHVAAQDDALPAQRRGRARGMADMSAWV